MKSASANRTTFIAPECTARRRILIAGMGTFPAVLTETVCKHWGNLIYFAVEKNQ